MTALQNGTDMTDDSRMLITYILMFLLALFLLSLPVIHMGQIDAKTAMLLVGGLAYAVWFVYRLRTNKK